MATNLSLPVSDVLEIMSDLRGESSTNTDAIRIRAVSRANQDFARRCFWRFYRLDDQTQVGTAVNNYTIGSSTYPMRMKGLTEVFVDKTANTDKTEEEDRYTIVDFNTYKNLYNRDNTYRMVYEWFDSANDLWKMHINPAPAATETITYTYYWEPPEKTATTDEVICPDIGIIARLALGEIYEGEDEQDLADKVKNIAEQLINEYLGKENSPAVNQTYSMGAIENLTTTNGIGTY
jgi:hypothetical protein